jgi:hypothetical protein
MMTEARCELLKVAANFLRDSGSEISQILKSIIQSIPATAISTFTKELQETGPMWSRIAQTKFALVPPKFLANLLSSLVSMTLPKLLATRTSAAHCSLLLRCASGIVRGMPTDHPDFAAFKTNIIRIYDLIATQSDALSKFPSKDQLECSALKALAAADLSSSFARLKSVIEDSSKKWSNFAKKLALRLVLTLSASHTILKKVLFSAAGRFCDSNPNSGYFGFCQGIKNISASDYLQNSASLETAEEAELDLFYKFQANTFSSTDWHAVIDPRASLNIVFSSQDDLNHQDKVESPIAGLDPLTAEFESYSSFETTLELFNSLSMAVLQKLDSLATIPDQHSPEMIADLRTSLEYCHLHPEQGSHSGLLQYVTNFVRRPSPHRELIIAVVKFPSLLGDALFLYHLSRTSLGFAALSANAMAGLTAPFVHATTPLHQSNSSTITAPIDTTSSSSTYQQNHVDTSETHSGLTTLNESMHSTSEMDISTGESEDAHSNLKKRKELALKMIDDLVEETVPEPKRATPLEASTPKKSPTSQKATSSKKSGKKSANTSSTESITHPDEGSANLISKSAKKTRVKKSASASTPKRSAPKPKQVCNLWIQHKCFKGDDCTFLHEGTQMSFDTICKFFRTGSCTKGDSCPFSHDLKSEACTNMVNTNTCKFGERCLYSHDASKVGKAKIELEKRKNEEKVRQDEIARETQLPFMQHVVPLSFNPTASLSQDQSGFQAPFSPEHFASPFNPSFMPTAAHSDPNESYTLHIDHTCPLDSTHQSKDDRETKSTANEGDLSNQSSGPTAITFTPVYVPPTLTVSNTPSSYQPPTLVGLGLATTKPSLNLSSPATPKFPAALLPSFPQE